MTQFAAPAGASDFVSLAELNGHLLLIEPLEFRTGIPTVNGVADAIEVNLVDLDTGVQEYGRLLFNVALKSALKPNIGNKVLATLGQGAAKPGKNAPWILNAATDDASIKKATDYLAGTVIAPKPLPVASPVASAPAASAALDVNDPAVQALLAKLGATPISA